MSELGLKLLVINEETKAEANENNRPDLWARAVDDLSISIVVMSPEQLKSSEYAQTLEKEYFLRAPEQVITIGPVQALNMSKY